MNGYLKKNLDVQGARVTAPIPAWSARETVPNVAATTASGAEVAP
jgi:hypothetical protein